MKALIEGCFFDKLVRGSKEERSQRRARLMTTTDTVQILIEKKEISIRCCFNTSFDCLNKFIYIFHNITCLSQYDLRAKRINPLNVTFEICANLKRGNKIARMSIQSSR